MIKFFIGVIAFVKEGHSMKPCVIKKAILILLIVLNVSLIWYLSLAPIPESAELSGGIAEALAEYFPFLRRFDMGLLNHVIRKLAHFCEFGLLGVLTALYSRTIRDGAFGEYLFRLPASALFCLSVASTDEMIQIFTKRGNQVSDVFLDLAGSLTGILFVSLLLFIIEIKRKE